MLFKNRQRVADEKPTTFESTFESTFEPTFESTVDSISEIDIRDRNPRLKSEIDEKVSAVWVAVSGLLTARC